MYELAIIGGGPAGVAAGVYAASLAAARSFKPIGLNNSATGKLMFSRPLSRGINIMRFL